MRRIEVLTAEAHDQQGCADELKRLLNLGLAQWRVEHPDATIITTETRLSSNQYRHVATVTVQFDESLKEDR
jgi:hypothetical protein